MFFKVILPQLYPYLLSSARSGLSLIWKIVLVVELLGRSNGVGFKLYGFFQFFDISGILAYTLAFVILIIFVEFILIRPFEKEYQFGDKMNFAIKIDEKSFINKHNSQIEVLKNIDINIKSKEFVCIVGPSGCGKTTLMNMIGGLIKNGKSNH